MTLEAIAFDLWETLISAPADVARRQETTRIERIVRALAACGHPLDESQVRTAYRSVWTRCSELYWSSDRDISARTQVTHFLEELAIDDLNDELIERVEDAYVGVALDLPPNAVPHARNVLRWARQRGLAIGLVSNTGRTPGSILRRVLDRMEMAESIDVMVFSNEVGECKPRPALFDRLANGLGAPVARTAFVGDNLYCDVLGAQRAGMKGIHFIPEERGLAVGPPVEHPEPIIADGVVRCLSEIPPLVDSWR